MTRGGSGDYSDAPFSTVTLAEWLIVAIVVGLIAVVVLVAIGKVGTRDPGTRGPASPEACLDAGGTVRWDSAGRFAGCLITRTAG